MTSFGEMPRGQGQVIRRRRWDVFISHARTDAPLAQALSKAISDRGFSVWRDVHLTAGEPVQAIEQAVRSSGVVLVLLSPTSLSSRWLRHEMAIALDVLPKGCVFPIAVGEVAIQDLPLRLRDRQWLHLRNERQVDKLIYRLLPSIEAALGERDEGTDGARVINELPVREPLVGVESYLEELKAQRVGVTWIVGAPGVGKTSLAREYAFHIRRQVDFILWQSAHCRGRQEIKEQILRVTKDEGARSGLIVVDGLDEMVESPMKLVEFLAPIGDRHRVLITTRKLIQSPAMINHKAAILSIGPLSASAATDYLKQFAAGLQPQEYAALEDFARSVGWSRPLITLASRYLARGSVRFLADVLSEQFPIDQVLGDVLGRLSEVNRRRVHVLAFCSDFLNTVRNVEGWAAPGDEGLFDRLLQWGIMFERGGKTIFAHEMIVESLRRTSPRAALHDVLSYVIPRLPDPESASAHEFIQGLTGLADLSELAWGAGTGSEFAELLIWQASVWRSAGEPKRAKYAGRRALTLAEESGDPELRVRAMNLQSALAFDQGRLAEACSMERSTAEYSIATFGASHPISLASQANLASSLRALGDLPEALTILRRVVDLLPPGDPELVAALNNLAICLREAGAHDEALSVLEDARAKAVSDPERIRLNQILAALLTERGELEAAAEVLCETLQQIADGRGSTVDNDILRIRSNLAMVYSESGRLTDSLSMQEEVVDGFEISLGPDHPSTLSARSNFALLLMKSGHLGEALAIFREVSEGRNRILGPDHPESLQSLLLVARAMHSMDDKMGALRILNESLADVGRILGPEHLLTFTVREGIADLLAETGDAAGATLAYRELVADLERVLSPENPWVQRVRASATEWRLVSEG
ncbi:tetratricopeptide repeat protein [Streptomyces harbinensis]|uniref:tetratricopeptide repeat protein n=1 Tax=Streptomyces harbinensis TaxID=1176198 RepID=UPI0034DF8B59